MKTDLIRLYKSLGDPTRMKILVYLKGGQEKTCQSLMKKFPLTQSAMSRHFNKMVDSGVLHARKEGSLWFYMIDKKYLQKVGINIDRAIIKYQKEIILGGD